MGDSFAQDEAREEPAGVSVGVRGARATSDVIRLAPEGCKGENGANHNA